MNMSWWGAVPPNCPSNPSLLCPCRNAGDWLWYTGQGGRDGANGTQVRSAERADLCRDFLQRQGASACCLCLIVLPLAVQGRDQEWTRGNAAIRECMEQGKPLRVCRAVHVEEE